MLYCCETCGKRYSTEEEALECERVHKEEKARQEELAKEKEIRTNDIQKSIKNLNKDIEKFFDDYGMYPDVVVTAYRNPPIESFFKYLFR